jgi:hypothetical protein
MVSGIVPGPEAGFEVDPERDGEDDDVPHPDSSPNATSVAARSGAERITRTRLSSP